MKWLSPPSKARLPEYNISSATTATRTQTCRPLLTYDHLSGAGSHDRSIGVNRPHAQVGRAHLQPNPVGVYVREMAAAARRHRHRLTLQPGSGRVHFLAGGEVGSSRGRRVEV